MCLVRWRKDSNKQTQIYPSIHQVGSRFPQGWFGKHHLSQKVAMSGRRFLSICVVGIGKVVVHQCSQWSKTQRWYIYIYTGTTECAATNDTLLLNASWFIKTKPSAKNNTIFKPLKHIPTINIYIYIYATANNKHPKQHHWFLPTSAKGTDLWMIPDPSASMESKSSRWANKSPTGFCHFITWIQPVKN